MKHGLMFQKVILLITTIMLLVACAPSPQAIQTAVAMTQAAWTPTTTSTPRPPTVSPTDQPAQTASLVQTLVSSVNDLLGVWWFSSPGVKLEFKSDGTFRFFYIDTTIDEGNYSFDNGQVFLTTPGTGGCRGQTATYDAYITKQDSEDVWLRLQVVGSDPCPGRGDTTTYRAKFLNP
jgi:hypothetical protein